MNPELIKKLNIKEEQTVLLINCPEELEADFDGLSLEKNSANKKASHSATVSRVTNEDIFYLNGLNKSGSISSDLNRDIIWGIVNGLKMNPNKLISMNEDWSIMSLAKKGAQKKPSKFGQDPPGVDRKTKTVIPPKDLQKEMDANPEAQTFFDSLAFSHRREYMGWIHDAKKEETRVRRIKKTIELLLEGKKVK